MKSIVPLSSSTTLKGKLHCGGPTFNPLTAIFTVILFTNQDFYLNAWKLLSMVFPIISSATDFPIHKLAMSSERMPVP